MNLLNVMLLASGGAAEGAAGGGEIGRAHV